LDSTNATTDSTNQADSPTPSNIGEHYVVERELGRGGMATVYLCTDRRNGRKVAIKVLRHELGSQVIVERFLREIAYASELNHPRIPKVLDSGVIGELPWYAMTYIEGESLKTRLSREKQMPIDEVLRITREVIEPTAYAHAHGIVHRDLKPDNILLGKDGVYVLDFGIARAIIESGVDRLTSTGIGVGTPAYMSPEQALGDRTLDARSDIYSLGCVVYEMIAGIPPFVGPTAQVIISRRFAASAPPLSELRESVPESIEAAVEKALAKAPADRWPTVTEFGKALGSGGAHGRRRLKRPTLTIQRRSLTLVAIGLVVIALIVVGFAWSRGRRGSFQKAQLSLSRWDLAGAESELRANVGGGSGDARSQLWLAQLLVLRESPPNDWKPYVLYANDHAAELSTEDRVRTAALLSLASQNYSDAGTKLSQLASLERQRTPNGFAATLSLADCLRNDSTVLPYAARKSGVRFESSYQLADSLYEGLLDRNSKSPAAYSVIMPRLEDVLVIDKSSYRHGHGIGGTRETYLALPRLSADTLAYTPYQIAGSGAPWRTSDADQIDAALVRNRQRLRDLATSWSLLVPNDSRPHEMLAKVLEATGELTGSANSAVSEVQLARSLATRAIDEPGERYVTQLRLGIHQVRLYLRLGRFDQIGILADSLLSLSMPDKLTDGESDVAYGVLIPLEGLRGRPLRVIELSQQGSIDFPVLLPSGQVTTLPNSVTADAFALQSYAETGVSGDSIRAVAQRVSDKIAAVVPPAQAQPMRSGALMRPLMLAAPQIGPSPVTQLGPTLDPMVLALKAFSDRNIPRTRAFLDSLAALHADFAPGEVTMDVIYLESWLRAQTGDTARATKQLDNALRGLSAALPSILQSSTIAASLVRVMALRAELAAKGRHPNIARTWAHAVVQLWGKGDALTAPTVAMMRKLE
jgi:predicted Ser/Thr protein kinase